MSAGGTRSPPPRLRTRGTARRADIPEAGLTSALNIAPVRPRQTTARRAPHGRVSKRRSKRTNRENGGSLAELAHEKGPYTRAFLSVKSALAYPLMITTGTVF